MQKEEKIINESEESRELTKEENLERIDQRMSQIKGILMLNEFYPPLNHGIKGYKGS